MKMDGNMDLDGQVILKKHKVQILLFVEEDGFVK